MPPTLLSYQFTDNNKFIAEIQTDLQPNVQITQINPTERKQFVYTSNLDDRHMYTTDYTAPYPCGRKIKINATLHRSEMVKIIDFPSKLFIFYSCGINQTELTIESIELNRPYRSF